jgi:hypothetical protein
MFRVEFVFVIFQMKLYLIFYIYKSCSNIVIKKHATAKALV